MPAFWELYSFSSYTYMFGWFILSGSLNLVWDSCSSPVSCGIWWFCSTSWKGDFPYWIVLVYFAVFFLIYLFKHFVYWFVSVWVLETHLLESVFSFHPVGPNDWAQIVRLGGKHCYLSSYPSGPLQSCDMLIPSEMARLVTVVLYENFRRLAFTWYKSVIKN